jgi:hypothetical protein
MSLPQENRGWQRELPHLFNVKYQIDVHAIIGSSLDSADTLQNSLRHETVKTSTVCQYTLAETM